MAIVSGSQHLPEGAALPQGDIRTSPAIDRCAKGEGGVWVNPGGRGRPAAVTAGEVRQKKVVSCRHSHTRKRPVKSGYSVANPNAERAAVLPRPSRLSSRQVSPYALRRGRARRPYPEDVRASIMVPSNFGFAIAIMIQPSLSPSRQGWMECRSGPTRSGSPPPGCA